MRLVRLVILPLLLWLSSGVALALYGGDTIYVGEEYTIEGTGFGKEGSRSALCFDLERLSCLSSKEIVSWSTTKIVFVAPDPLDRYRSGRLYIFKTAYDKYGYGRSEYIGYMAYRYGTKLISILPASLDAKGVRDVPMSVPGKEEVVIRGGPFGPYKGIVYFIDEDGGNAMQVEVVSWSSYELHIRTPDPVPGRKYTRLRVVTSNKEEIDMDMVLTPHVSDDPFSFLQWYLSVLQVSRLWEALPAKKEVVVAVIDDGVYLNHEDLKGHLWTNPKEKVGDGKDNDSNWYKDDVYGWNFVTNSGEVGLAGDHGTVVAGVIGAVRDNKIGIAGIADKVKVMPLVVCGEDGCDPEMIDKAIYYAVDNGARVINLSLGSRTFSGFSTRDDAPLAYARKYGVTVVVAAGNGDLNGKSVDLDTYPVSPVCNGATPDTVIGVGALSVDGGTRSEFSNTGSCVDLYAIGESVLSLGNGTSEANGFAYEAEDGTSFSAPQIAGLAALTLGAYPDMSAQGFYQLLMASKKGDALDPAKFIDGIKKYEVGKDAGIKWSVPTKKWKPPAVKKVDTKKRGK